MQLEKIIEITRIKQEIREVEEAYKDILPERIKGATDALDFAQALIGDEDREVFLVMCLNIKNEITVVHRCHVGALGASIIHPREVFKSAIMSNAHSIIVAHNHPSGSCQYSQEDVNVSERLIKVGKILNIEVLDSLIVSQKDAISLKERMVI
ncbi:JAB domain-containing protein (plasmid) [Chryseomicrobium palamuruense]